MIPAAAPPLYVYIYVYITTVIPTLYTRCIYIIKLITAYNGVHIVLCITHMGTSPTTQHPVCKENGCVVKKSVTRTPDSHAPFLHSFQSSDGVGNEKKRVIPKVAHLVDHIYIHCNKHTHGWVCVDPRRGLKQGGPLPWDTLFLVTSRIKDPISLWA